jgi:membrane protease YdiL (CAAX protease family)
MTIPSFRMPESLAELGAEVVSASWDLRGFCATTKVTTAITLTADVSYHRLARTSRHRWWRPILGSLVILIGLPVTLLGVLGALSAIMALIGGPQDLLTGSAEAELALTVLTLALLTPLTLLAARWVQRRPAGTVSSVTGRLRRRWLATCLLLAVPVMGLSVGVLMLLPGEDASTASVGWQRLAVGLAVVVLLVPLQAAGEEYFFRGWMVQALGSWTRSPWPGIVVSSAAFGLAHGLGSGWGMADLMVFGVVTAGLTIRTGGLEAAIGLHVINNVSAFGFAVVTGAMDAPDGPTTAASVIVGISTSALYGVAALWLATRRGIQNHAPISLDPSGPR